MAHPSELFVLKVASVGFSWRSTERMVRKGQRMFRRGSRTVPLVFAIVSPSEADLIWIKGDRWQVYQWGPPASVIVMSADAPGWWHEAGHILLGNVPEWNNHQSRAKVRGMRKTETIMGVTPEWARAMRLSKVDKQVIIPRLPLIARRI